MPYRLWQKPNLKKYKKIVEWRNKGLSYRAIAKQFKMNHTRVSRIYKREIERERIRKNVIENLELSEKDFNDPNTVDSKAQVLSPPL